MYRVRDIIPELYAQKKVVFSSSLFLPPSLPLSRVTQLVAHAALTGTLSFFDLSASRERGFEGRRAHAYIYIHTTRRVPYFSREICRAVDTR